MKTFLLGVLSFAVFQQMQAIKLAAKTQVSAETNSELTVKGPIKIPLERTQVKSKARAMLRSMAKTRKVTSIDGLKEADIDLANNFNYDYIGTFYVGNPPQEMRGCFDTGSANAWILSSYCTSHRCTPYSSNYYFTPEDSSTFVGTDITREIEFGSGILSGFFGFDDFRLGPGDDDVHIVGQTLGLIIEEAVLDDDYDAIIGLAFPTMADVGWPVFDSMINQGLLVSNIFAFYMTTNDLEQSELSFGAYDETKFVGDISWHDVVNQLFWSLKLDDIKYNGVAMNLCQDKTNCYITPDSGTSLLTAPTWAYEVIIANIPQVEDCVDKYSFGNLTFVIDGVDYDIPSSHFMEKYVNLYEDGDSICMTSISPLDIMQYGQENLFIVGDSFMQEFYTIFDRDNNRVGLATSKQDTAEDSFDEFDWYEVYGQYQEEQ